MKRIAVALVVVGSSGSVFTGRRVMGWRAVRKK